jgi:hypothetical protein
MKVDEQRLEVEAEDFNFVTWAAWKKGRLLGQRDLFCSLLRP